MGLRGQGPCVDAAYQAASELALLAGAAGFTAESRTAITRASDATY